MIKNKNTKTKLAQSLRLQIMKKYLSILEIVGLTNFKNASNIKYYIIELDAVRIQKLQVNYGNVLFHRIIYFNKPLV